MYLVQSSVVQAVWSLSKTSAELSVEIQPLILFGVYLTCFGLI